ncbi:MAG: hypothetical protein GXN96_00765 [Aquificae bacterium]|nr:hypothetical protein [Aquificota bacterium]
MKVWGKVIKAICEEAKDEKVSLYFLESDGKNWYGARLEEFCSEDLTQKEDYSLMKKIKDAVRDKVEAEGFIVLVSPMNLWADIYEHTSPRYPNPAEKERPYGISFEGFRLGFFGDKKRAVDFMLGVAKRLREDSGLHLHLFFS